MSKAINIRNQAVAPQGDAAYEFDMQQIQTGKHFTAFGPDAYEWTGQEDTGVDIDSLMAAKELAVAKGISLDADGNVDGHFSLLSASRPAIVSHVEKNVSGVNIVHVFCAGAGALRIELSYKKIRTKFYLVRMVLGSEYVTF